MTRARKFLHGVSSGYLVLMLNALYTLASVPVVLSYLSQDEFGVWIVVGQMAGYLSMIDLGTSSAGMRLIIDHKDAPDAGTYGSLIKTIALTQFVQALLILVAGISVTGLLIQALRISPALTTAFQVLWLWQVLFLAMGFVFKLAGQLLMAHQRTDVNNHAQSIAFVANFIVLWMALAAGMELYSFVIAQGAGTLVTILWTAGATMHLQLLPTAGCWGRVSGSQFRKLFGFGAEMFLVALGTQLILTSQTFLITRWYGLSIASVWSVMTKVFLLLLQVVQRLAGASMPAFAEMMVRQEYDRLWRRYRSLFDLLVLASCGLGLLMAVGNSAFVSLWTHGKIQWPPVNDWLLACWFVLLAQMCLHNSLILNTKEIGALKFIYFFEGALFIATAAWFGKPYGLAGLLTCSIVCTLGCTLAYGTWRVAALQGIGPGQLTAAWLRCPMRFLAVMSPLAIVAALFTPSTSLLRLGIIPALGIVALLVAVRLCTPRELTIELASHLPPPLRKLLLLISGIRPEGFSSSSA